MARITKLLVIVPSLTKYNSMLSNKEILDTSIVFIKDTKQIWTHGMYYSSRIINNLTDGGSTNSLSAEQGKTIKSLIDSLSSRVSSVESELNGVSATVSELEVYSV